MTVPGLQPPLEVAGLPDLWPRVRAAGHRLLALDYDGTLAPFRIDRMAARPRPDTCSILEQIRDRCATTVAIISGRPVEDLAELMGHVAVPMIGAHGWERRSPDGTIERVLPDESQREALSKALTIARGAHLGPHLEPKVASIALHVRAVTNPQETVSKGITLWQPLASEHNMELRQFNGGVELRAKGRDKGVAFLELHRSLPPGTLPVYVGDDETDEDALLAVRELGIGIKVGEPGAATAARGWLASPDQVLRFLYHWEQELHQTHEDS